MRRRFFVECFAGTTAILHGEAAHHLGRVLRAQPGQLYELSDGRAVWLGRVERAGKSSVEFSLLEQLPVQESRLRTTLLLSIVKFDRLEWCLEKATELGVAEIVPLAAARSEKTLVAAAAKRAMRWEKILLESAQQSRRLRPPELSALARPGDAFRVRESGRGIALLLSERETPSLKAVLSGKTAESVTLAIGPEGGWTDEEFAAARAAGFVEASLGGNILRTETAVIAALAALNFALAE